MLMSATIKNSLNQHEVEVQTNGDTKQMSIAARSTGYGSSINGDLFL